MRLLITTAILGTALITMPLSIANAREVKELVGHNVTTTQPADVIVTTAPTFFSKADKNNDGFLTLKEFKAKASIDNEYERFIILDKNKDKMLDIQEYTSYEPGKGNTVFKKGKNSNTKQNWNVRSTTTVESKFVPIGSEEAAE